MFNEKHKRIRIVHVGEKKNMKKVLVVVDMQNDFISMALGTKEAKAIVPNVVEKVLSYPKENIYFTLDTHEENYMETQEGKNLPVPHCIKGSEGWKLHSDLIPYAIPSHVIEKPTFGSLTLAETLKKENEKEPIQIELVGLCTDICVVSNALLLKPTMPEVPISVDETCCAGVTPEAHLAALATMRSCQIEVTHGNHH